MLFKSIFKIIGRHIDLKPHKPPVLGRWCLHYDTVADRKADMTNEDHCGVCDKMRCEYLEDYLEKINK